MKINTIKKILVSSAMAFGIMSVMNVSDSFANEFKAMSMNQQQKIEKQVQLQKVKSLAEIAEQGLHGTVAVQERNQSLNEWAQIAQEGLHGTVSIQEKGNMDEFEQILQEGLQGTVTVSELGVKKYTQEHDEDSIKDQIYQFVDAQNSNAMLYNNSLASINWNNPAEAFEAIRKDCFKMLSAITGVDYTRFMKNFAADQGQEMMEQVENFIKTVPLQHRYLLSTIMFETGQMLENQAEQIQDSEIREKIQDMGRMFFYMGPTAFADKDISYKVKDDGKLVLEGDALKYYNMVDSISQDEMNHYAKIVGTAIPVTKSYMDYKELRNNFEQENVSSVAMR